MESWLNKETTHEGFPFFLRRSANVDIALRATFPKLAVVTHTFTRRLPNGLPDPDYNDGLAALDQSILTAFDVDRMGMPVLIETFGGRRNYYFYVASKADVAGTLKPITKRFSKEKLAGKSHEDPTWDFLEQYSRQYF